MPEIVPGRPEALKGSAASAYLRNLLAAVDPPAKNVRRLGAG